MLWCIDASYQHSAHPRGVGDELPTRRLNEKMKKMKNVKNEREKLLATQSKSKVTMKKCV